MKYNLKYGYMRFGVLLAVAVYDTIENDRTKYTEKTLYGFLKTVNFNRHTLFISDNGSCKATQKLYAKFKTDFLTIFPERNLIICLNGTNLGTAKAINKAIQIRERGQKVIKCDNDVFIHATNWIEQMEEALERDHALALCALKRNEVEQNPWTQNPDYRTTLRMLPCTRGQRWIVVEETKEVIGTAVMMSGHALDRLGGLLQPTFYGFDDSLLSLRSHLAGFKNCYLPHIVIDHLDNGAGKYVKEKIAHVTDISTEFNEMCEDFRTGVRDVFVDPYDET